MSADAWGVNLPPPHSAFEFVGAGLHLRPTPAGTYYAVSRPEVTPMRYLLLACLADGATRPTSLADLCRWTGLLDTDATLAAVFDAQERGWLEGFTEPVRGPSDLSSVADEIFSTLSSVGVGLLTDAQGTCLARRGLDDAVAFSAAAVAGDLLAVHTRHSGHLTVIAGGEAASWAVTDAVGNIRLGFWPIYIGNHRFALALGGMPRLHHPAFVDLVAALVLRLFGSQVGQSGQGGTQPT